MPPLATPRPAQPLRLHRFALSGHAHRVELMLNLLDLPYECVDVDLTQGAHLQPAFLQLNPFAQVPVLEDGETVLPDSNAILLYLVERYDPEGPWWPSDVQQRAQVQRWFSVAAGPLASGPAAARIARLFGRPDDPRAHEIAALLLQRMQAHLSQRDWLVGDGPTLADVSLYTYTAHAPEGGVSLAPYPAVRDWLARVERLPRFVPMARKAASA
ncbi:MAG: glutathione S-transferase [Hydrogenophaga sp.]|uniref:glutathione S-transferase family protein n=1 Tax=Hydrogenophaga sp. TaxID=1904254 RepID=UPI001D23DBB4|nr:glutathione S-transferase [Hydrogenophaga sp.]MBX3608540.1 glutathione S-transferase [Hydrogenophaga sp.]